MRRRVWNTIKAVVNQVVHGGEQTAQELVESTGTSVLVSKLGPNRYRIDLKLRGDDA